MNHPENSLQPHYQQTNMPSSFHIGSVLSFPPPPPRPSQLERDLLSLMDEFGKKSLSQPRESGTGARFMGRAVPFRTTSIDSVDSDVSIVSGLSNRL